MKNCDKIKAIILASGSGSRFGAELPKQYCDMLGRPLLMHTIECFTRVMPLDAVLLVIDSRMDQLWRTLCIENGFTSPRVTYGGTSRTESLAKALDALAGDDADTVVMIHDGARPIAGEPLIRRMMSIPEGYSGAIPAIAVTDTLRLVDRSTGDNEPVDRSAYVAVQTPQTFTLGTLREAYARYGDHAATDDATLVQRVTGGKIALADGDPRNIKVTNPTDIAVAEAIIRSMRRGDLS